MAAEAGDGDEALASLLAAPPDIAFLDIRVPGTSGIEIARRFSGKVHVVFVTAHGEGEQSIRNGGDLCLP